MRAACFVAALIVLAMPGRAEPRDPFAPHVVDDGAVCTAGPGVVCARLDTLTLRGVVVGVPSRALFEDAAGRSFVLKIGDVVGGWRVAAVRRGAVVFAPLRHLDARSGVRIADVVVALD